MNSLVQNKQLIHVAAEVLVIGGMAVYFQKKNTAMQSELDQIKERCSSYEKLLNEHSTTIKQIVNQINNINVSNTVTPRRKIERKVVKPVKRSRIHTKPVFVTPVPTKHVSTSVSFNEENEDDLSASEVSENEVQEDLDKELENELGELSETSLKKGQS